MKEKEDQPTSVTKGLGITTSRISARVQYVLSFVSKDQDINEGQDTHTSSFTHLFSSSQVKTTQHYFYSACYYFLRDTYIINKKKGLQKWLLYPSQQPAGIPTHPYIPIPNQASQVSVKETIFCSCFSAQSQIPDGQ